MLYVRLFEGCNVYCEHCFIPSNPKKMELDDFVNSKLIKELEEKTKIEDGDVIYIQWHGGEPTALGVDFIEKALEQTVSDRRFKYINGIQTNLISYSTNTDKWTNFYKKYFDGNIGVSWDFGIRHLKSISDPIESNKKFEERFWDNVVLARGNGLKLYFVITLTKKLINHYKNPYDLLEFLVKKDIEQVNFERITQTGEARQFWSELGLNNLEYSSYMSKLFKAYYTYKSSNPNINLNISPFDGLINSVNNLVSSESSEVKKLAGYGCWSGFCDKNFHTIDASGYKSGCTALNSEQDNKNKKLNEKIVNKKIIWLNSSKESDSNKFVELRNSRKISCNDCQFTSICSSGCLSVEKWDNSGECSGGKGLFESIYKIMKLGA